MLAKKTLVFGKNGQIGSSLSHFLSGSSIFLDHEDVDLSKNKAITKCLDDIKPDLIINAAAYTDVEKAEDKKQAEQLYALNAEAPGIIAKWCNENKSTLIHYSTDYVFDGEKRGAYTEDDEPNPLNEYGLSKLAGEKNVQDFGDRYIILRTSWVYSAAGKNFVKSMLHLGQEREEIKIVHDQLGSPSSAIELARATSRIVEKLPSGDGFPSGVYHLTGYGSCTWYEFAQSVFDLARDRGFKLALKRLVPIKTDEFPTKAKRPLNSVLNNNKFENQFGFTLPRWGESLVAVLGMIHAD